MTRSTSREAFRQLVESGALKGKQRQVLEAVLEHGPATSAEIIRAGGLGENVNLWRARFTELHARGLIVEAGVRKCKITGRTALVWEYSERTKPLDAQRGHDAKLAKRRARVLEVLKAPNTDLTIEQIADRVMAVL